MHHRFRGWIGRGVTPQYCVRVLNFPERHFVAMWRDYTIPSCRVAQVPFSMHVCVCVCPAFWLVDVSFVTDKQGGLNPAENYTLLFCKRLQPSRFEKPKKCSLAIFAICGSRIADVTPTQMAATMHRLVRTFFQCCFCISAGGSAARVATSNPRGTLKHVHYLGVSQNRGSPKNQSFLIIFIVVNQSFDKVFVICVVRVFFSGWLKKYRLAKLCLMLHAFCRFHSQL